MKMQTNPDSERQTTALTRLELLACMGATVLLILIIVPALASSGSRSDRVICFNNLRQIGVAYGQFGLEHADRPPWRVSTAEGGNQNMVPSALKNNVGIQFSAISNHLQNPRSLADPGDKRPNLRPAQHWGQTSGGFRNPAYLNNAVSYFLGVDGGFRVPSSILAGDRNVKAAEGQGGSGFEVVSEIVIPNPWTNDVHGLAGNIVLFDGSAAQVDSKGLEDALKAAYRGAPGDLPPRYRILTPSY
jgi:hypothetical protein